MIRETLIAFDLPGALKANSRRRSSTYDIPLDLASLYTREIGHHQAYENPRKCIVAQGKRVDEMMFESFLGVDV
jgi:hypothetical protein